MTYGMMEWLELQDGDFVWKPCTINAWENAENSIFIPLLSELQNLYVVFAKWTFINWSNTDGIRMES